MHTNYESRMMGLYITMMPELNTPARRTNVSWLAVMQCMSMGGVGKCYDNARMKSLKLKREEVKKIAWKFIRAAG